MTGETPQVTRLLADFARTARWDDLPSDVRTEAVRQFLNFVGCALGGARHPAVERTYATVAPLAGGPPATLIGRGARLGAPDAALINCQASAAHAYDDTHLASVTHPAGPIAAPLLAEAEQRRVSGEELLTAFAIGVEVACRIASMLTVPPAELHVGWYPTGVACPIGAAAAVARLRGMDGDHTVAALGVAASQSAGFRNTHGSMLTSLVPGFAARTGYMSALLAEGGVTSSDTAVEGRNGFAVAFAPKPHLAHAAGELGQRWEMRQNMAKPYPCGIVIHPILDGALAIAARPEFDAAAVEAIDLALNPLCLTLTDRPEPPDSQRAQVSLQHWTAAALARGRADIEAGSDAAVADPAVLALRAKITAKPDGTVKPDSAVVRVRLAGGQTLEERVEHATGSLDRPMTDAELDAKFLGQATMHLSPAAADAALALCRRLPELDDASDIARAVAG